MTEANEAMKSMARRIAADAIESSPLGVDAADKEYARIMRMGYFDNDRAVRAALAAIMETQEACAKLAEAELVEVYGDRPEIDTECNHLVRRIATAIRTGAHYALAGDRHG